MKRTIILVTFLLVAGITEAKTINSLKIEDGGSGPYKAEIIEDNKLQGYSIIRPADLEVAVATEGKLPVILFGNGGCARNSWPFHKFLTHIASHGYVILTNGVWSERFPEPADDSSSIGQTREEMLEMFKKAEAGNSADARDFLRALDWLESEASRKKSEYYGMVDTDRTAAMGQSCGGLQALILGTSGDPRIKTTIPLNSGITSPGDGLSGMVSKGDLSKLKNPICYLIGGKSDIAYPNATDDYRRITNVPAVIANLNVGHGGTFNENHGGSFAEMALLWLDWQLKGKEENGLIFRYSQVPAYMEGWTMTSKNLTDRIVMSVYNEHPETNTEVATENEFGEVMNYQKVNDPSITVCLPEAEKADGSAVVIFPGGALVSLTWDSEFKIIADWLNARGVAAIGVKYRLRTSFGPMGRRPAGAENKFTAMKAEIFDFVDLEKANTNPAGADVHDPATDLAADDALNAMDIIIANADKWNIDPERIGWMGFSAGGGVALAALMKASESRMPAFFCSVYGPSLVDITVPENAPKLYVAVHADHPNVAAGCMALFMEWKKAGIDSEIHVYGKNTGGFYGGRHVPAYQKHTSEGYWLESFYSWMTGNGFTR